MRKKNLLVGTLTLVVVHCEGSPRDSSQDLREKRIFLFIPRPLLFASWPRNVLTGLFKSSLMSSKKWAQPVGCDGSMRKSSVWTRKIRKWFMSARITCCARSILCRGIFDFAAENENIVIVVLLREIKLSVQQFSLLAFSILDCHRCSSSSPFLFDVLIKTAVRCFCFMPVMPPQANRNTTVKRNKRENLI